MTENQFSTFRVDGRLYGINVKLVQEITKAMPLTPVPLAPDYIKGLINLRGQIATAVGLRELFKLNNNQSVVSENNVVCKLDGLLLSLIVDEIGDVIEVSENDFEENPDTISQDVSQFMSGVYKLPNQLLSIVDINKLVQFLHQ
jgi:purine-binding chemotaxis protein CheW